MTIKEELEAFAARCHEAREAGETLPIREGANLRYANLPGANLAGANLAGADLTGANLYRADLFRANLAGANLSGANLSDVDLRYANLSGAILTGANLTGANLYRANLAGANLSGANLSGANLYRANLSGVDLSEGVVAAFEAGNNGGYRWYALRLQDDTIILQYGCERHPLAVWQGRGPEYGKKHNHDEAHWAKGPAIAIAVAANMKLKGE